MQETKNRTELAAVVSFRDDDRKWGKIEVSWSLHWSDGGLHRKIHPDSPFSAFSVRIPL
jgi:hypothetical protein